MNRPLVATLGLLLALPILAGEPGATALVGTAVRERALQGQSDRFPAAVGQLACLSEVRNLTGTVVHVWFHGDTELIRIELPVRGERYRTWSVKRIPPDMTGPWRVEVRDQDGKVLGTASFTLE